MFIPEILNYFGSIELKKEKTFKMGFAFSKVHNVQKSKKKVYMQKICIIFRILLG